MIAALMLSLAVQLPCSAPAGHLATVLTETTTDVADVPAGLYALEGENPDPHRP